MAGLTCDPFAEKSAPWWRASRQSSRKSVPKRYAIPAGVLGSLSGLGLQRGDGLDKPTRFAIVTALAVVPPFLVDRWWSERRRIRERRIQERLFVLPD
jgi:hypothetical protein